VYLKIYENIYIYIITTLASRPQIKGSIFSLVTVALRIETVKSLERRDKVGEKHCFPRIT
jgi:hypothetical protein